jgi:hypothetical protein
LLSFVLLWDGIPGISKGLNEKFVAYLSIRGRKNGSAHQCASKILNESLMAELQYWAMRLIKLNHATRR